MLPCHSCACHAIPVPAVQFPCLPCKHGTVGTAVAWLFTCAQLELLYGTTSFCPKAQEKPSKGTKKSQHTTVEDASDDKDDRDYAPPKKVHNKPSSPDQVHNSDGEENISDTEYGAELVQLNHF